MSFKTNKDEKLERGDIKIKSGSIEISEIVSNKVKFSVPNEIEKDLKEVNLNPQK